MTTIIVKNNNVEKALRVLKRKQKKDGFLNDLKDRQYYQKPSEKRRLAKKRGIARWKKDQKTREETI
jgi:small subunit ribosomal protein S21